MDNFDQHLGKTLKSYRIEKKLTQIELSMLLNFPQSYVSKYEICERKLTLKEIFDICKILDVPMHILINSMIRYQYKYNKNL